MGQVRREKPVKKPAEGAQVARLRENGLQLIVGREYAVDFWQGF
jgi:hypothetical protein